MWYVIWREIYEWTADIQVRSLYDQKYGRHWERMSSYGRGFYFIDPEDKKFKERERPSRMLVRNWKHQWILLCPATQFRWIRNVRVVYPMKLKTRLTCILEADESTRLRIRESLPNHHEDHIARRGNSSLQHYTLVHKFILVSQCCERMRWNDTYTYVFCALRRGARFVWEEKEFTMSSLSSATE